MQEILFHYQKVNPTTWVYLSSLLMIGIFFKFTRLWSIRNVDLIGVILLAPGLLMVIPQHQVSDPQLVARIGYLWLFCVSGLFILRLLLDWKMVRRPLLEPNLNVGGMIGERSPEERMREVFDLFPDLEALQGQMAGTLSGGESRMVACGRALMQDPALLLLDEPTAGLSPLYVDMFFEKIQEIHQDKGVSIILAEQNANKALEVAERVMVLSLGESFAVKDAAELTTDQLKEGYRI